MEVVLNYWPILLFIFQLLQGWATLAMRKAVASPADLTAMKELLDARIDAIEKTAIQHAERLQTLPGNEDVLRLDIKLTELHGDHKALKAEITGLTNSVGTIDRSVDRIEKHLIYSRDGNR